MKKNAHHYSPDNQREQKPISPVAEGHDRLGAKIEIS